MTKKSPDQFKTLPLDKVDEPVIPDRLFIDPEYIKELAESIRESGLMNAILVRPVGDRYEVIFGHRRLLAHRLLELKEIKAVVRELTDTETAILRATENIQQEKLTPIEEGHAYKRLKDKCGLSWEEISKRMGKSIGVIRRRVDLLRMPPMLQEALQAKKIIASVAEELWPISDPTSLSYYLSFAIDNGCTRDIARNWANEWKSNQRRESSAREEGGQENSPFQPRPYYIACDVCNAAVELGHEVTQRICTDCNVTIKKNM